MRGSVAALAAATATLCSAAEPPAEPILRIETGMHAATVRRVIYEPVHDRLVTTGDDRTVRMWQLPEGRLWNVLRFPIGPGHEGRIFAMAASPDGRTIAAAGWTGWEWDREGAIYLFDAESGEMTRRVSGLPETVGFLAYSKDGRHLAVGLQGGKGLRILRTSDYALAASDTVYGDKILGADFARDGRLAVASLDGLIRLYDARLRLVARKRASPGKHPLIVKFSPDGARLAVSFHDAPVLSVHSAADLSLLHTTDAAQVRDQTRMADLAWSSDGEYLYGCGDYSGPGRNPIYRWSRGGLGALERILAAEQRLTDLHTLPGGRIAFTAEDPAIGIIDAQGRSALYIGPELANFRDAGGALRASADGAVVEFPLQSAGRRVLRFSLAEKSLAPAREPRLPPPAERPFPLGGWKDGTAPSIGAVRLALDEYEVSRSRAAAPGGEAVVLGTEWALRAYAADGALRWKADVPGVAWNVVVTADGRSAIATLGDGTLRWYRMEDGVEYLALFPHAAGEEWIAWTPQGYYVSSNYGDNFVGWHLNRGRERSADFFRAVQFERILYRPDVVLDHFRARGLDAGVVARRASEAFDVRGLAAIAPPRIRISSIAPAPGDAGRVRLRFGAERNSLPMQEVAVYVNNIPVTPAHERALAAAERSAFERELDVELPAPDSVLRIEVANGRSIGLAERAYRRPGAAPARGAPGDLYLLAVGVNRFQHLKGADLAWAARDAEEIERFFAAQARSQYARVFARVISDNTPVKPDRASILEALGFIEGAGPRDTVMVFLASHGISDAAGSYYFVPRDALDEDVSAVIRGGSKPVGSLIGWSSFFDALRRVAGRRVLVVDTCQARNIEGRFDLHSLAKRSASSLFSLVVASKGDEESQEYPQEKHGLFTYALLSALRGAGSDANGDGFVTLNEAFNHAVPLVESLRSRAAGPQTPQIVAPDPLGNVVLARTGRAPAEAPPPPESIGCGTRTLAAGRRDPRCAN